MPTMRDIKRRIKSITNIRQITRAMKMVAAAKLRRAQERMLNMRPYAREIERILLRILPELNIVDHPLLVEHEDPQKIGALIISSDRGLCGGFNTNLVRKVQAFLKENSGKEVTCMAVGRKIERFLKRTGVDLLDSYVGVMDELTYTLAYNISEKINEDFCKGRIETVYLIYNEFKSVMSQNLIVKKILPLDIVHLKSLIPPEERGEGQSGVFEYEPESDEFANLILPRYLSTMIYRAFLESYASELSARMTAMGNATKNGEDMISSLTLTFNKARQAAITKEILEIVGGAEALRG
ncbi:MAG: ATP synthase F1 subunit gamma [Planctomycetota bacterium]